MKVDNLPGLRLTVATLALTLGGCNTLPEAGAGVNNIRNCAHMILCVYADA